MNLKDVCSDKYRTSIKMFPIFATLSKFTHLQNYFKLIAENVRRDISDSESPSCSHKNIYPPDIYLLIIIIYLINNIKIIAKRKKIARF